MMASGEPPSTREVFTVSDAGDDLAPVYIRAGFGIDYDVGRIYRLTAAATGFGAVTAILDSRRRNQEVGLNQRLIARAVGAVYLGLGGMGLLLSPSHMALWFQRRPRWSQSISALPLLLVGATGGGASPLRRLAVVGVAGATGMRGRRRESQVIGLLAWLSWCAQVWPWTAESKARHQDPLRVFGTPLVAFLLSSRVAAPATLVAYDTRALVGQLFEFTYERQDLESYEHRIKAALTDMREMLQSLIGAEPREGVAAKELRDVALAALGRLEERLGTLEIAALADLDLDRFVASMRPRLRLGKSEELEASVSMDHAALRGLLEQRVSIFTGPNSGLPPAAVNVDEDVIVPGLDRLALLGALTVAMASNASRHAIQPVTMLRIDVEREGSALKITIMTNGSSGAIAPSPRARRRAGLAHLRRQIEALGGELTFSVTADGVFTASGLLPVDTETETGGFWSGEIRKWAADTIMDATRIAAVRAALTAVGPRVDRRGAAARKLELNAFTVAHAALPIIAEALSYKKLLRRKTVDTEAMVLLVNAIFTYYAASYNKGLTTTWLSGFASRYAFDASQEEHVAGVSRAHFAAARERSQQRARLLMVINLLAMIAGARRSGRHLTVDDVVTVILAPTLTAALLNPAQTHVAALDRGIAERLTEVESLNELADSFHTAHSASPTLRPLPSMLADRGLARRVQHGLEEIERSEQALLNGKAQERAAVVPDDPIAWLGRRLKRMGPKVAGSRAVQWIWPEPRTHYTATIGEPDAVRLGHLLAMALGRRVWPARIKLEFLHDTLQSLPQAAVESARFRREAAAAMDMVGRELNHEIGRALDGRWNLRQVDLRIGVVEWTGSIECELKVWAPPVPRWRLAVDRWHDLVAQIPFSGAAADRLAELGARLEAVNASLVAWNIHGPHEYDRFTAINPPAKRVSKPSIELGAMVIQLHPQQYVAANIDMARRLHRVTGENSRDPTSG
jgi:hypothetical protein